MTDLMALLVALAAQAHPATKYASPAPVLVYGIGTYSCAKAHMPQHTNTRYSWLMGYFTARNVGANSAVGSTTDMEGFAAEVKKICDADPSGGFVWAAEGAFAKLRKEGR